MAANAKQIFTTQQSLVSLWSDLVVTHEANLLLLLNQAQKITSNTNHQQQQQQALPGPAAASASTTNEKVVALQTFTRTVEDALGVLPAPSTASADDSGNGSSNPDLKEEYRRRGIVSLTYVIDEIYSLKRQIEDSQIGDEYKSVCRRLSSLLANLIKQCFGLVKTKLLFDGKLDRVRLLWLSLADGISAIAQLNKRQYPTPIPKDENLVNQVLEEITVELRDSTTSPERTAFAEFGVKVFKVWQDRALTGGDVLRITSLYLILNRIGYKPSHGLFTKVLYLCKISPIVPITFGRKCVKLEDYLFQSVPTVPAYASNQPRDLSLQRRTFASSIAGSLDDSSKRLAHETAFKSNLQVAEKCRHLIFSALFAHSIEKRALPKVTLNPLLILAECLGSCEEILVGTPPPIVPPDVLGSVFASIPTATTGNSANHQQQLQENPFVQKLLDGAKTLTPTRAIALMLSLASSKNPAWHELQCQSEWEALRNLRRCCETSSLFSPFSELFEPMVKMLVDEGDLIQLPRRLPHLVRAFRPNPHTMYDENYGETTTQRLVKVLDEWLVDFLFEQIDEILRSRVVMKQNTDTDLLDFSQKVLKLKLCLNCQVLDCGNDVLVSLKSRVQSKLAISWHEMRCTGIDRTWETYAEMLVLAREYFGLEVYTDSLVLSVSSALTGCDVLEIASDIPSFCAKYNYNLNQEFFIERRPHGKYVNCITVDSIARSIRAHGSGILSTVVNVVYQFLAMRFEQFSQSLFDEHVKSYLKRERRWMAREQVSTGGAFYPFERATDFSINVKQGSFLGKIKQIVIDIGNALGFVRSVRSAGMKWAGSVHRFVPPKVISIVRGQATSSEEEVSEAATLNTLGKHVNDTALREFPDYLQVLIDVFRKLDSSTNEHLKNAFMIIPALCVDFVDSILHAKDQVARAHKNPNREAYFTDDGFVMGIAAILAMLSQDILFDSLKFFKGVAVYFESAIVTSSTAAAAFGGTNGGKGTSNSNNSSISNMKQSPGNSQSVEEDVTDSDLGANDAIAGLSKRRHRGAAREYELLMYAMSGARVFFKRVTDDAKVAAATTKAGGSSSQQTAAS